MPQEYEGLERREHDRECDIKLDKIIKREVSTMREWVTTQICLATKGSKIWNKLMRPIVMLILAALVSGQLFSHVVASDSDAIDAAQDEKIISLEKTVEEHHEVQMTAIAEAKEGQKELVLEQKAITKDVGDMKNILGQQMIILEFLKEKAE